MRFRSGLVLGVIGGLWLGDRRRRSRRTRPRLRVVGRGPTGPSAAVGERVRAVVDLGVLAARHAVEDRHPTTDTRRRVSVG